MCTHAGPPGGALTFGSFTEPPSRHPPHTGSQPQAGPGLAQQRSGLMPQGPSQQTSHQQQQRRNTPAHRHSQGYKGPAYDAGLSGQQGGMHPNAAFNFMPSAGSANYLPQQQYPYAQQAHYYQNGMMIPQGGYQQPAYAAPQPPTRNPQQGGYPRTQTQPGRSGAMAPAQPQQSPPSAPAVPPMKRKTKALDIIDPTTQKKVSPRSECAHPHDAVLHHKGSLLKMQMHTHSSLILAGSAASYPQECFAASRLRPRHSIALEVQCFYAFTRWLTLAAGVDAGSSEQGSAKPSPTTSPQKDQAGSKPAASKGLVPTKPAESRTPLALSSLSLIPPCYACAIRQLLVACLSAASLPLCADSAIS